MAETEDTRMPSSPPAGEAAATFRPFKSLSVQTLSEISGQLEVLRSAARRLEEEREEARRRERHLGFVRDLAHHSGGRIPFQDFLQFCAERLCPLLALDDCAIVLMNATWLNVEAAASARTGAQLESIFGSDAVTREVLREGSEILCDAVSRTPPHAASAIARWHDGALLSLPLTVEDTPFGVLHLARRSVLPEGGAQPPGQLWRARSRHEVGPELANRTESFSRGDIALAREVAYEVALAMDGARRFHEMEQKALQLERSREEIRSYFSQVGAAMSTALNLNQLLRLIVSLCIRVTQAHGGSLYLIENHRLRQRVVIGPDAGSEGASRYQVRESLMGWNDDRALDGRASLAAAFPQERSLAPLQGAGARVPQIRSFLGVPLVIKDEVKGQLNIYTRDGRDFSNDEVALLTTFARQAAMAIENAQVFEFESQRAREATLLYKAARAIALSPDLDDVLDISTHQLLRITDADRCLIFLANARRSDFRVARSEGLSPDQQEFFSLFRLTPSQFSEEIWESLTSGRHLCLTGPSTTCPALSRLFTLLPTNSCLLVPLLAKENLLGLIFLDDSKITRYFDASQVRMVMTLSIQIATAVQRARLMQQLEENVGQLKALHQVSRAVTGTLSLPRVLDLVLEKAGELLGSSSCTLLVAMDGTSSLRLQGVHGVPPALAEETLQNEIAAEAVSRKRPVTWYGSGGDEAAPAAERFAEAITAAGLGGVLSVPLVARRKVAGVLNCFVPPERHFTAAEMRLIRSFANQAAAALENARLHDIVKNKVHELAILFEIGKTITSTLQLDRVLEAITESVHRVMEADACAIMLLDPTRRQLVVKTALGLGPQHTARTIRLGRGIAGVAAKTGRPMILIDDETPSSRKFPDAVRRDGLRTILSVPMHARGRIVGLINVYYKKVHYNEPSEMSLLTTLSSQAAIAIENACLYQEKNQVSEMLRNLLLPRERIQHERLEVGHRYIPSSELSGDYYEMVPVSPTRAVFMMADVAGKGPRAAMYAARAKYVLKSYIQAGYACHEVVTMLNRLIAPETEDEMFITLFCGEVDVAQGELSYSSAGHEPPLLWRANRKKCRLLKPHDIIVGVDRNWQYLQKRVRIGPGDLLVLYTDGVTEARGAGPDGFGLPRLQALVEANAHLPAQTLVNRITSAVLKHTRRKLNDDFSLMVVRIEGETVP